MNLQKLIDKLRALSDFFRENGIADIYTNSKIFEVLIANQLGHQIINGHAYTPDAKDQHGNFYEYKHYKQSSSNHTWTFNDFTVRTIEKLYRIHSVHFVVINDASTIPAIEKIYCVSGAEVAKYMEISVQNIWNKRKMINISAHQITENMQYELMWPKDIALQHPVKSCFETVCSTALEEIFLTAGKIEQIIHVDGILTSNKLWELLVACHLNHRINSEQKKHDAYDVNGKTYEYKVSTRPLWTFQDISENVLASYQNDEKIILALVDKSKFAVNGIIACHPNAVIELLKKKLSIREKSLPQVRRLTACIGRKDVSRMIEEGDAVWIHKTF